MATVCCAYECYGPLERLYGPLEILYGPLEMLYGPLELIYRPLEMLWWRPLGHLEHVENHWFRRQKWEGEVIFRAFIVGRKIQDLLKSDDVVKI